MPDLWEVFLSPHTDDETLAMAGAISRAHLAGLKTRVVLVTDNLPSAWAISVHQGIPNLAEIRREEFHRALCALHVDAVEFWEIPERPMRVIPLTAQQAIMDRLVQLHLDWDIAHVHTTVGFEDIHVKAGYGSIAHALCANVVTEFAFNRPEVQATLHGVYVYSKLRSRRQQCGGLQLLRHGMTAIEWEQKQQALRCYLPNDFTVGYGFRSVPDLFKSALSDPHEYVIEVTHNALVST
jgi:LmbE family N-acetylglucosaminyl deacetylase